MGVVAEIIFPAPPDLQPAPGGHVTEGQGYSLIMPALATDPMRVTSRDGQTFTWTPTEMVLGDDAGQLDYIVGSAPAAIAVKGREARYVRTFPDADDVFVAQADGVKHWTILKTPPRAPAPYLGAGLRFGVSGLIGGVPLPSGRHDSFEAQGFILPRPFATDLAGTRVDGYYEVVNGLAGQTLFVWFDAAWFSAPDRVYPATIDPTVSTTTTVAATAFPQQRKSCALSGGKLADLFLDGTTIKAAITTDAFQSVPTVVSLFTNVAASGGFHVEPDANDNLYVTYTGVGASAPIMLNRATPTNAARTTWAVETATDLGAFTGSDLPVCALGVDGANTIVHVVLSRNTSTQTHTCYIPVTVAANGTRTVGADTTISNNYGPDGGGHTFPSITPYGASSFDAWWYGRSGSVHFRRGTWIGGAMSWGPDRSAVPSIIATAMGPGVTDATGRSVVTVQEGANVRVFRSDTAGAAFTDISPSPAQVGQNPTITLDDKDGPCLWYTGSGLKRRRHDGSTWGPEVVVDADTTAAYASSRRGASGSALDVAYTTGTTSPIVKHDRIVLNQPPMAPTIALAPASFAAASGTQITITHNDSDQLSAWALYRQAGTVREWWNNATKAFDKLAEFFNAPATGFSVVIPTTDNAGKWISGTTYPLYAATRDSQGLTGPYNSTAVIANAGAVPNVAITSGATANSPDYDLAWTVDVTQGSYRAVVKDGATPVSDTGTVSDTGARVRRVNLPTTGKTYAADLTVTDTTGIATTVTKNVTTSFTTPTWPTIAATPIPAGTTACPVPHVRLVVGNPDNLLTKNQSDVETDLTGIIANNGATLSRDTTGGWHGAAQLKVVTTTVAAGHGFSVATPANAARKATHTVSVYLFGTGTVNVDAYHHTGRGFLASQLVTLTGQWQRIALTATTRDEDYPLSLYVRVATPQAVTFYADGMMINAGPLVPWTPGGVVTVANTVLRRIKDAASPWTALPGTVVPSGSYNDTSAASGMNYLYKAVAIGDNGTTAESNTGNGGFEYGLEMWLLGNTLQPSVDTIVTYSGKGSLKTTRPDTSGWITVERRFPCNPGDVITWSGAYKLENVKQYHIKGTFFDAVGTPLLATQNPGGTDAAGTTAWLAFAQSAVTAPPTTTYVTFDVMGGFSYDGVNPGICWTDALTFTINGVDMLAKGEAMITRDCWWFVPVTDSSNAIPFAYDRQASWQHDRAFQEIETRGSDTRHVFGGKKRDTVNITATYIDPVWGTPHESVNLTVEQWRQRFIDLVGVKGYLLSPQGFAERGILEPPSGQFVRDMIINPMTVSCRFVEKKGGS